MIGESILTISVVFPKKRIYLTYYLARIFKCSNLMLSFKHSDTPQVLSKVFDCIFSWLKLIAHNRGIIPWQS